MHRILEVGVVGFEAILTIDVPCKEVCLVHTVDNPVLYPSKSPTFFCMNSTAERNIKG